MTGLRRMVYINAHLINRAYGGPEEGGWWFDYGEPLAAVPVLLDTPIQFEYEEDEDGSCVTPRVQWRDLGVNDAHAACLIVSDTLKALDSYEDKRHDIGSVICDGKLQITISASQANHWPEYRPRYE